jgi:hypothetical protein
MATLFVSPFGDNTSPGTLDAPFRTIEKGVKGLTAPGDVLYLRGGSYAEDVTIADKDGEPGAPIVIRAYGREHVSIDGAEPIDANGHESHFRRGGNNEWKPATDEDPDAHPDEYISVRTFPPGGEGALLRHGAFMDREPYTQLITYARLEDLRADNEAFGRLPLDDPLLPFPGFPVVKVDDDGNITIIGFEQPDGTKIDTFKHPWVYMGPGLFYDEEAGRIHVRLSHTHNNVPGIVDYDGGTDPRQVRLAISHLAPAPLVVRGCSFVHVDHLDVRFGGDRTIRIENSSDVVLDHLRVWAANEGIRLTDGATSVVLRHCEVRGGIPTWMFRSDIKDVYKALDGNSVLADDLGHGTSQALLSGTPDVVGTVVHNCEFVDGHDLFMFGQHTRFHHNLIDNLHDDGLVVETEGSDALEVDQNVIMRCLEAIGFAKKTEVGGSRSIHHNLIDLRNPTASIRPRPCGHLISKDDVNKDGSVFRYGQLYKSNKPDGALDLFHNTCLVAHQSRLAGIQHYANSEGATRRSANNIYADVTPSPENADSYASAFLPRPDFSGSTDGNFYFQLPKQHLRLLRHAKYDIPSQIPSQRTADSFDSLEDYRNGIGQPPNDPPNAHHEHSKIIYPPGFEKSSREGDPLFHQVAPDGVPQFDDDLRLKADSPARDHGVELDAIGITDPLAPPDGQPDMGCYTFDTPGLEVGVDGRRRFPEHP